MAKRRMDEVQTGGTDILSQVPSVATLERRLAELTQEAARVESLLECVRRMQGGLELVEAEPVVSAAGQV